MSKRIHDIKPGEVYNPIVDGVIDYDTLFLKLRDQKAVKMNTYTLVIPDQNEMVELSGGRYYWDD